MASAALLLYGEPTAYNTGHKRRSLRSLGLRQIFTSAIATVKTSYAPVTLCETNGSSFVSKKEIFMNIYELDPQIVSLHRHWCIADSIKYAILVSNPEKTILKKEFDNLGIIHSTFLRLCVWYSLEYILIEGYKELKIVNEQIDLLLIPGYVDKLRLFRNATFHYQKNPISEKLLSFLEQDESQNWVKKLHKAFKDYFEMILPIGEVMNIMRNNN